MTDVSANEPVLRIPPENARISVGGHLLAVTCSGDGIPTVILDAGLGEGKSAWAAVQGMVGQFTRVCSYDRFGVGESDAGTLPRTSQRMVEELRALLQAASILPPYVLVGHSLGGLNMQLFATLYSTDVAGIVLVDPSFPDVTTRVDEQLGEEAAMFYAIQFSSDGEGMTADDFRTSCRQVADAGFCPDVPVLVLSAGQEVQLPPEYAQLQPVIATTSRIMRDGHNALVQAIPYGELRVDPQSSHAQFRPETIVEAIREVVEAFRASEAGKG
ncbi:MAG: alpha/beta hydrolase [Anaerolineae bacterium]